MELAPDPKHIPFVVGGFFHGRGTREDVGSEGSGMEGILVIEEERAEMFLMTTLAGEIDGHKEVWFFGTQGAFNSASSTTRL